MKQIRSKISACVWILPTLVLIALTGCSHLKPGEVGSVQRITKEELRARLENPDTIIVDVRTQRDWEKSDKKIPGAVWQNPSTDALAWVDAYDRGKSLVLYCA